METKNFELTTDVRMLETSELISILTDGKNSVVSMDALNEQEIFYGEAYNLNAVLNKMTATKRKYVEAGVELYKRLSVQSKTQIRNSDDIYNVLFPVLADCQNEECWVIFLNQAAKIIKKKRISMGGITSTSVDIRVILKEALLCNATSMVLCHNHPSGNIQPSIEDDRLTQSLYNAGKTLNIRLLDHVIVTNGNYFSYADDGKI